MAHRSKDRHRLDRSGKPWQNGDNESFNGKFRDECLSMEWFRSRTEARVLIEIWRRHYTLQCRAATFESRLPHPERIPSPSRVNPPGGHPQVGNGPKFARQVSSIEGTNWSAAIDNLNQRDDES